MAELEPRVTMLEQQVNNVLTKLDMFIAESREARQRQDADIREMRKKQDAMQVKHDADMREMHEKHGADMREIRQDMKDMQAKIDAKFDSMDSKIESIGQHVRNMSVVTMIGIAAMVVAVLLK